MARATKPVSFDKIGHLGLAYFPCKLDNSVSINFSLDQLALKSPYLSLWEKHAIIESGSVQCPWAMARSPRKKAFQLGNLLGCKTTDARELIAFLRNLPCQKLVEACPKTLTTKVERLLCPFSFAPSVEKPSPFEEGFLLEHPSILLQKGLFTKVPLLAGVNSHEGIFMLVPIINKMQEALSRLNSNMHELIPWDLQTGDPATDKKILQQIMQFYFQGKPISKDNINEYIDFIGDITFILKFWFGVKHHVAKSTAPVYIFQFSFGGQYSFFKNALWPDKDGASHGDELFYLFSSLLLAGESDLPASAPERLVRRRMVKMWANFVKTGKPIGETSDLLPVNWLPASRSKMSFLDIGRELELKTDIARDRIRFWESLYRKYSKIPKNRL